MANSNYDEWERVFKTGQDYEAGLVRDRLRDADIPAVVLNKKDHAIGVNYGDLAQINVLVPADRKEDALALLHQAPLTDVELAEVAMAATPFDEDDVPVDDENESEEETS